MRVLLAALVLFVPVVAAAAEPAALGGGSSPLEGGNLFQVALGLLAVLVVIIGLAWLGRRVSNVYSHNGAIKVIGALSMGQRERVVLVQVGEQQLLLGVAPGRVQTLHVLEQPLDLSEQEGAEGGGGHSFARRLRAAMSKHNGG